MARRRDRLAFYILLPAVLAAVGILAYFTFRTTLQVERLRQQSVLEATLGLASEKADRLDKRIIEQDNVVFAIADPARLTELTSRWLPTAQRETPTVRAILVLDGDAAHDVLAFASRAGGAFAEEEAFRRLLVQRMCGDMELAKQAPDELRHLHHDVPWPELPRELLAARRGGAAVPHRRVARHRPHREGLDAGALRGDGHRRAA